MIGKTVEEPSIAIFPFKSDELAEPPLSLPHAAPTTAIDATVVMSAVFFIQDMINFPPRKYVADDVTTFYPFSLQDLYYG